MQTTLIGSETKSLCIPWLNASHSISATTKTIKFMHIFYLTTCRKFYCSYISGTAEQIDMIWKKSNDCAYNAETSIRIIKKIFTIIAMS